MAIDLIRLGAPGIRDVIEIDGNEKLAASVPAPGEAS
jgi:hypothetical protein